MPASTLTQEQLNARFALEQHKAEAEIAAVEDTTVRENEENRAKIVAMEAGAAAATTNTGTGEVDTSGALEFAPPPQEFLDSITDLSYSAKTLLWYGLSPKTRQGCDSAISLDTLFCATRGVRAWPASELVLAEWISGPVFGSDMAKQS